MKKVFASILLLLTTVSCYAMLDKPDKIPENEELKTYFETLVKSDIEFCDSKKTNALLTIFDVLGSQDYSKLSKICLNMRDDSSDIRKRILFLKTATEEIDSYIKDNDKSKKTRVIYLKKYKNQYLMNFFS